MSLPHHISNLNLKVLTDHTLAPHTYFKIGGPADFFVTVNTSVELVEVVKAAIQDHINFIVLGGASNVLIPDAGYRGLVIKNLTNQIEFDSQDPTLVTADSGTLVNLLVNTTIAKKLKGLEEFLGIPGTVGGAVYNNSHHLKHLIGDYIKKVSVIDRTTAEPKVLTQSDLAFAYDASVLQQTHDVIVTATFDLTVGVDTELRELSKAALSRRKRTQPLEYPSSGCMFKNLGETVARDLKLPAGISGAGYLIDQAGLKGTRIGGAEVSPKHANFIINTGGATSADVVALSDLVIQKIKHKYGVTLEREVFLI